MGKESVLILRDKIDVTKVIENLNMALSEEWLAFYQYWIGSIMVEGPQRGTVQAELMVHATEEFAHAKLLADRIKQLEGIPVLDPKQWFELAKCEYAVPSDFDIIKILGQNLESERCAIRFYQGIIDFCEGKDYITSDMAKRILASEEEHEQDLQDYLLDIYRTMKEEKIK